MKKAVTVQKSEQNRIEIEEKLMYPLDGRTLNASLELDLTERFYPKPRFRQTLSVPCELRAPENFLR